MKIISFLLCFLFLCGCSDNTVDTLADEESIQQTAALCDNGSTISDETVLLGQEVTAKAVFKGGAEPIEYQFSLCDKMGNWHSVTAFTESDETKICLNDHRGKNSIKITAKDKNGMTAETNLEVWVNTAVVDYQTPYSSARVYEDIDKLVKAYPALIKRYSAGKSEQGKDIPVVTLGNGSRKVCIVAGIHAREHITISFTMRCIEEYAAAYYLSGSYGDYDMKEILDRFTFYIVPMSNPDGTDISAGSEKTNVAIADLDRDSYKTNANGVNLNRNFPFNWENEYSNTTASVESDVYPGKSAGSEAETKAIMNLCEANEFEWLLDMHIVGSCIYWRDTKNKTIPNDLKLATRISQKCGYRLFGNTKNSDEYSGGLENWFRYQYQKPALCIELIPPLQAFLSKEYKGYHSFFDEAVVWSKTKYTYLEAAVYND